MTLELPFGISTRKCSRDEQLGINLTLCRELLLLLCFLLLVVLGMLKIKDLMMPFIEAIRLA